MSRLTLKEQLQALSLVSSAEPSVSRHPRKPKKPGQPAENARQKPAWLEQAKYGVELLKAYFPDCFKERNEIRPLKIGIKQDLVKRLSTIDNLVLGDKACMLNSLAYYVSSLAYHKGMVEGAMRIDLDGNSCGVVTAEEAQYSLICCQTKAQKKSKPVHHSETTACE